MRGPLAVAVGSLLVTLATAANAQEAAEDAAFTERAQNVVVVDNVGGYLFFNTEEDGGSSEGSDTFGVFPFPPIARLGYHRFFGPVSLGAGFHFSDIKNDVFGIGGGSSTLYLGIAPRIGAAFPLSTSFAIWLRAGLDVFYASGRRDDTTLTSIGGEAFGVFTPVRHFGFTFGPTGTYGVGGKTGSRDTKVRSYGFTFGFLADF